MKHLSYSALALLLALAGPAAARPLGHALHSPNPSLSLSPSGGSPVQQQIQSDYATQLQGQQRDLLQQNPSGLSRDELSVGHQLNGYLPR